MGNGFELVAEIVSSSYLAQKKGAWSGYSHIMIVVRLQRLAVVTALKFQLASNFLISAIILLVIGRLPVQRRRALDGGAHGAGTQCVSSKDMGRRR